MVTSTKGRCKTCKWYKIPKQEGFEKDCSCLKMRYGYSLGFKSIANKTDFLFYNSENDIPDGVVIEDDEGWGMVVGPEFGCIHHEESQ